MKQAEGPTPFKCKYCENTERHDRRECQKERQKRIRQEKRALAKQAEIGVSE